MSNLFLAGGGSAEDSRELDCQFVTNLGAGRSFAYVPVAMPSSRYPDNCRWIESVFLSLGVRQIAKWTSLEDKTLHLLRDAGGLYIGGGNTVKLLREVRSSGFAEALRAYAQEDGPIYGGSAGAILLGASIKTAPEASALSFAQARGLDLLHGYSVFCHYDAASQEALREFMDVTGSSVIALPERAGLHVQSRRAVTSVGYEPALLFNPLGIDEIAPQHSGTLALHRGRHTC